MFSIGYGAWNGIASRPRLKFSNYAICYEGIQRVYRNAVVRVLRENLQSTYPNDWEERLKKPFLHAWDGIVESAEERRKTGELSLPVRDQFDYLGVNHFFNLFDVYFDCCFPAEVQLPDSARQREKQAVLGWAREIKALRDPTSHRAEDDLADRDAFRMLDAAHRILRKLDSEAAANELHPEKLTMLCGNRLG
jgi:hypothetical protein